MNQKEKFFKALQNAQAYHTKLLERNRETLWNDFQGESADEENATGTFTFNISFRDSIKPIDQEIKVRSGIRWNIAKKDEEEGVVSDQPEIFDNPADSSPEEDSDLSDESEASNPPESQEPRARRYLYPTPNNGTRELFVATGIGDDLYSTYWLKDNGSHKRLVTSHLPERKTFREAQEDLDNWAEWKNLKEFEL